jgi:AcrR family transcriptional regulator
MSRPREFDRADVLDRATRLFWRHGYGGTSLNELEAEMGIGRTSIYGAFGGKEGLFLEVVDHYDATYSFKLRAALKLPAPYARRSNATSPNCSRLSPTLTCRWAA